MVRIIDRRFDSKKKSAVNRQRFMRRFKHQIRRAVSDAIGGRSIRDVDSGENISIPSKDLSEPHFQHGEGGVWETVFSGNDRFSVAIASTARRLAAVRVAAARPAMKAKAKTTSSSS